MFYQYFLLNKSLIQYKFLGERDNKVTLLSQYLQSVNIDLFPFVFPFLTEPLLVFFQQKIIAVEIENINWELLGYIKNVHLETPV